MKLKTIEVEKSFTLSLQEGYRKVTVKAVFEPSDDKEDWGDVYQVASDFVTERMKEEKAKFTK